MAHHRFPQDYPCHLDADAPTEPLRGSAPLGDPSLHFEDMHWVQFEQFCWWLLQRDHDIKGCQRVGGPGHGQGGIDLFGYAANAPAQLIIFECKCHKRLRPDALTDAVETFLDGPWATPGTQFVLIIAQQCIGYAATTWHAAHAALRARDIAGHLWTGMDLTERVRRHPDILVRFFSDVAVGIFCNEWMRRVDFMAQLQKALVDQRPSARAVAQAFIGGKSQAGAAQLELEHIYESDGRWSIRTPWVHIDALLPNERFVTGSVAIVVTQHTTSGLTVALSQEWLLTNLLAQPGAPTEHSFRPFIVGPMALRSDPEITIDLHGARLQMPVDGLHSMCEALDRLAPVYTNALRSRDQWWGAEGFPFLAQGGGAAVAMCTITGHLWGQMREFAYAHNVDAGDGDWHVFSKNLHHLQLFTKKAHPDFEPGYHALIRARSDIEGFYHGDEVVLTWHPPPNSFGRFEFGSRRWMRCAETLDWLRDRLLPAVGKWLIERQLYACWPWHRPRLRRELASVWAEQAPLRELRQLPLLEGERYLRLGLVATIEELETSVVADAPRLYVTPDETQALTHAVLIVMQGGRGYAPHICADLGLDEACLTHRDIVDALRQRTCGQQDFASGGAIRWLLNAVLEGLGGDDAWLQPSERESIYAALQPLMRHCDDVRLVAAHTRWA